MAGESRWKIAKPPSAACDPRPTQNQCQAKWKARSRKAWNTGVFGTEELESLTRPRVWAAIQVSERKKGYTSQEASTVEKPLLERRGYVALIWETEPDLFHLVINVEENVIC